MSEKSAYKLIDEFLDEKLSPRVNFLFFAHFFKKLSADLIVLASNHQRTKVDKLLSEVAGLLQSIVSGGVNIIIRSDKNKGSDQKNNKEYIFAEMLLNRCSDLVNGEKVLNYNYLQYVFRRLSQLNEITKKYKLIFVEIVNKLGKVERVLKKK